MKIRTWQVEHIFVFLILATVAIISGNRPVEWIGVFAVLLTFAHTTVSDRMAEKESLKSKPDVDCYKWSTRYFVLKEILWLTYFFIHQSYTALIGVIVFLIYPIWRRWYRKFGRDYKRKISN